MTKIEGGKIEDSFCVKCNKKKTRKNMDMDARSGITYNKLYKMAVQFFIYI
jgi:hypothetical protein